jgi:hypothetical protein
MQWDQASKKDDATLIPYNWIHIHYYDALNTLFRLENSLRVFVYVVLKNRLFDKWSTINVTSDDANPTTIAAIAKGRRNQARDYGYLGYDINCPVMYLTSGELIRIITDDSYWHYFNSYFPASKQIIKHKLDEIGVIRNSLAHFRPLRSDDVEVIKNNANHALSGVDHFLEELGSCYDIVPTNTQEDWYLHLSNLSSESCKLTLTQCRDQTWVELHFRYHCNVIITHAGSTTFHTYRILNIITPSILQQFPNIAKYATCVTERAASGGGSYTPQKPSFSKDFSILFSRHVLTDHYEDIKNDIDLFLDTIEKETQLISSDNLAKGKLVSVAPLTAQKSQTPQWWSIRADATLFPVDTDSLPEYWGNVQIENMFTSTWKYPWMPIDVSGELSAADLPFE